jgi:hypothetical protein
MKKLIITCVLLTSVSFAASAQTTEVINAQQNTATQNAANPERKLSAAELKASDLKAEKSAKAMQTKLGLSAEQYEQVYASERRYQNYMDRFPAGKVPAGTLSNITSGRNSRMQTILTPEQFQKFQGMAKQTKQK